MFVSAIIAAGGRGLRFGGGSPKQLLTLGGRPILARSVDAFVACDVISEIVVALTADLAAAPPAYLEQRGKPLTIVSGGDQRRASVANAFARVSEQAEIVVIHDAARPLVSDDLIRRTVAAASESGAAIAALTSAPGSARRPPRSRRGGQMPTNKEPRPKGRGIPRNRLSL